MKNKVDNSAQAPNHLSAVIRNRRSVRAFLDKAVDLPTVREILDTARWAPSGVNTQPWQVAVLGETHRRLISNALIEAREHKLPENPDYAYYPKEWIEPYKSRRKACGAALYGALDITIEDIELRKIQWYQNYLFFKAPVALIFYIDTKLSTGSWLDMGMFIQNVMLSARCLGLETCPQASLAEYPDIIRQHLSLKQDMHIVCGMSIGYADWDHPVNQYRTPRAEVDNFTVWYD